MFVSAETLCHSSDRTPGYGRVDARGSPVQIYARTQLRSLDSCMDSAHRGTWSASLGVPPERTTLHTPETTSHLRIAHNTAIHVEIYLFYTACRKKFN